MAQENDKTQLIADMRKCASVLTEVANDPSLLMDKTASVSAAAGSTSRAEYMSGIMHGLFGEE